MKLYGTDVYDTYERAYGLFPWSNDGISGEWFKRAVAYNHILHVL